MNSLMLAPHSRARRAGSTEVVVGGGGGSGAWPNEPAGMTTIVESDWSEAGVWQNLGGSDDQWTGNGFTRKTADLTVVDLTDHPLTGTGKALQLITPETTPGGTGPWGYHTDATSPVAWGSGWREVYIGWWTKLAADFYGHPSGSNKHCNIIGRADDGNWDSFWAMPWGAAPTTTFSLRNDASAGLSLPCGHSTHSTDDVFFAGVWLKMEMWYQKPLTQCGGGHWKCWKNGSLLMERTDISDYAFSGTSYLRGMGFHGTWGGGFVEGGLPQDNYQWFANFRVSAKTAVT